MQQNVTIFKSIATWPSNRIRCTRLKIYFFFQVSVVFVYVYACEDTQWIRVS